MSLWRFMSALFVALVLSVSFAVPAEDVPETAYDESESLPYEGSPAVSLAEQAATVAPAARACALCLGWNSLEMSRQHRIDDATGWTHPMRDSLPILDRSLRC